MHLLAWDRGVLEGGARAAVAAVGGMWTVPTKADRSAVVAEVRERGLRALHVDGGDPGFLEQLPQIEFVELESVDLAHVPAMPQLRYLALGNWKGALPWSMPRLEWAVVEDGPRGRLGIDQVHGAVGMRALKVANAYAGADLSGIGSRQLRSLWLERLRGLTSLAGIERHAETLTFLSLFRLSGLTSLAPLADLPLLESLSAEGVPTATDLAEIAKIPGLRALSIFDQRGVESLAPLAGHPTLEFIAFGRTKDMDLSPLAEVPRLRMVHHGHQGSWQGSPGEVLQRHELDMEHEVVQESFDLYGSLA